jgi:hypothetical protein
VGNNKDVVELDIDERENENSKANSQSRARLVPIGYSENFFTLRLERGISFE